jgi:hypothetical protein
MVISLIEFSFFIEFFSQKQKGNLVTEYSSFKIVFLAKCQNQAVIIYLFIYIYFCGGNVHHCGKVILKKGIFCHKYPVFLMGKKHQRKRKTIFFIFKIAK